MRSRALTVAEVMRLHEMYNPNAGADVTLSRPSTNAGVGATNGGEGSGSGMGERDDETGSVEIGTVPWDTKWDTKRDEPDLINHPPHYTSDPSGVECITITRHRNFNVGNAIKYLWRAGLKKGPTEDSREAEIEDLKKARWYLADEIRRLGGEP